MNRKEVAELVRAELGEAPSRITHIPTGMGWPVYEVRVGHRRVFVKIATRREVAVQSWILERVRRAGVPTPRVLAADPAGERLGGSWLLMEAAPGVPIEDLPLPPDETEAVARDIGTVLRRVHAIEMDGVGWLHPPDGNGSPRAINRSWSEMIGGDIEWSLPFVERHRLLAPGEIARARRVFEQAEGWLDDRSEGSLLHSDFRHAHIFVVPGEGRVASVIDWQGRVGDPAWDLALFVSWDDGRYAGGVLEAYGAGDPLRDRLRVYAVIAALGRVRWFHERHPKDIPLLRRGQRQARAMLEQAERA